MTKIQDPLITSIKIEFPLYSRLLKNTLPLVIGNVVGCVGDRCASTLSKIMLEGDGLEIEILLHS